MWAWNVFLKGPSHRPVPSCGSFFPPRGVRSWTGAPRFPRRGILVAVCRASDDGTTRRMRNEGDRTRADSHPQSHRRTAAMMSLVPCFPSSNPFRGNLSRTKEKLSTVTRVFPSKSIRQASLHPHRKPPTIRKETRTAPNRESHTSGSASGDPEAGGTRVRSLPLGERRDEGRRPSERREQPRPKTRRSPTRVPRGRAVALKDACDQRGSR
eukprot:scaffold1_cov375-Pavlova_lutheri.AAC.22